MVSFTYSMSIMALQKKGKYWYGSEPEDLNTELIQYSNRHGSEAVRTEPSICVCGCNTFELEIDEDAGSARSIFIRCGALHLMGDSQDYADEAEFGANECICGKEAFECCLAWRCTTAATMCAGITLTAAAQAAIW